MKLLSIGAVAVGLALSAATSYATISLGFSSVTGSLAEFQNGKFLLSPTPGSTATPQFTITYQSVGTDVLNLKGWIDAPTLGWTIGSINTAGATQTASVTGTGKLHISDGSTELTGDLTWLDIVSIGTIDGVNLQGGVNITGITYAGSVNGLQQFRDDGNQNGIATLSFQFGSPKNLTQLKDSSKDVSTYSGTLAAVPEPSTVVAGALLLLPFGAGAFRSLRKNRTA